jgi:hypothetical protein
VQAHCCQTHLLFPGMVARSGLLKLATMAVITSRTGSVSLCGSPAASAFLGGFRDSVLTKHAVRNMRVGNSMGSGQVRAVF